MGPQGTLIASTHEYVYLPVHAVLSHVPLLRPGVSVQETEGKVLRTQMWRCIRLHDKNNAFLAKFSQKRRFGGGGNNI